MAHQVEEAANEADESLKESLGDLKSDFSAAYEYEHRPAPKAAAPDHAAAS